jgi:hypothetical protein
MLIEMLKYLHRTALSLYSNYVPCIIHNNSSSIRKTTKIPHFEDQNPQIPSYADTSFTNIIYTKSSTLPSSKISRIMHTFQHSQIKSAISPGWAPRRLQNYQYRFSKIRSGRNPPSFAETITKGLIPNRPI